MRKIKFHYLLLFILFQSGLFAQNQSDRSAQIDAIFSEFNKPDVPGASIMVVKNSKIIFKKGYGLANLEEKIPAMEYTNYRLASVTKQFTAMCIMILYERGKISYEDRLTDIFPDFPNYGKKITTRHLLNHTSGLVAYEDLIPEDQKEQLKDKDVLEMMKKIDSTYFEPGSSYRYSNTGYALLAMIVEKFSGKSFAQFLKENIFEPLGMTNSVTYEKGISEVKNRAYGYSLKENGFERTDQSLTSAVLGDGGIYTSIMDYYKWDQALYTEKIVKYSTFKEALTSGILNNGKAIDPGYGFGWRTDKTKNINHYEHSGSTIGFSNHVIRIPELQTTVIALTNRNNMSEVARYVTAVANLYTDNLFKTSIDVALRLIIEEKGIEDAIKKYHELKEKHSDKYDFKESNLNSLGYKFLETKRNKEAIEIFRLNLKAYPESSNALSSLGEAYMLNGDKEKAMQCFEKSLKINSKDMKAIDMMKKLSER
jgi:CubicO group peptidase (beta-lactamase class C family)